MWDCSLPLWNYFLYPARSHSAMEAATAASSPAGALRFRLPSSFPLVGEIAMVAFPLSPLRNATPAGGVLLRPAGLLRAPCCLPDPVQDARASQKLGILIEVEGVLADVNRFGNRQAFNVAFQKLGLDCANWTEPIYLDLSRKAAGDEERMLILFFNRIGWPTSLPTNEKEPFLKSILREKRNAVDELVISGNLPLRPGAESFIDDALNDGMPVILLTACSKSGDKLSRFLVEKLGSDRISKIKIVGKKEMEGSLYGQLVLGKGLSSSLDEQLAKEARKAASIEKQRIAEEVASALKLSVDLDTSPSESFDKIVATLRAGAEYAGLPVYDCVLVAGSQSAVLGAERIGMPCAVIRNSLTSRAEFRSANAVMDGFGGADLTISKLRRKRWS